jgi:hypothetical protein
MNTLKTLTSAAVLVSALAGAATANTVTINGVVHTDDNTVRWSGTTPQFAGQCSFSGAADQDMNFDEASNTWTVDSTTAAVIAVTMRDVSSVSLEPVDSKLYKLDGTEISAVDVDYIGTTISGSWTLSNGGSVTNFSNTASSSASDPDKVGMSAGAGVTMTGTISFDIEGTVSHSRAITDSLESNTDYYVDHMITCTQ